MAAIFNSLSHFALAKVECCRRTFGLICLLLGGGVVVEGLFWDWSASCKTSV